MRLRSHPRFPAMEEKAMKRITGWILLMAVLLTLPMSALAIDQTRSYTFDLTVNGQRELHVLPGDVVTVVFTLRRNDSGEAYTMFGMQNEIAYDENFVKPVENGSAVNADVRMQDIALRGGGRKFYMNYVSFADGVEWNATQIVGTFQLEIIGTSGVTTLSNQNYKVSLRDGGDAYQADCQDLRLIVSNECEVSFETNGGTPLESVLVPYNKPMERPEDPVREGWHVEGWYSDIDLTDEWDFENDPVLSNMILYAKWARGNPQNGFFDKILDGLKKALEWVKNLFAGLNPGAVGEWIADHPWILAVPLALIVLLILLFGRRKCRVIFETNGGAPIEPMKVKRNQTIQNLPVSVRGYSVFCGWYKDAATTDPWYADVDQVKKKKTRLYAKWL